MPNPTVTAYRVLPNVSSRPSGWKRPVVIAPNPSSACRGSDVSLEPACKAYPLWTRFISVRICLQSPRPMRLRPENGECFNRWESLIFQNDFKLFRRAPINPEKQHPEPKKNPS